MCSDESDTDGMAMATDESDANEPFHAVQSWSHDAPDESPSDAVLLAMSSLVEDQVGVTPVYDTLDLDALDALFTSLGDGTVTFHHAGYDVVVHASGEVAVTARR